MARKKRGRPKKVAKAITYDSKETSFALGLISFAVGAFAIISYVITEENSIFAFIRKFFGDASFLFAIAMISLSLRLFGAEFFLTRKRSIVAQFLITIFYAALIAVTFDPFLLKAESEVGRAGGIIGYELGNFSLNNLFLNLTAPILVLLIVIFVPSVLGMSVADFFNNVYKFIVNTFVNPPAKTDSVAENVEAIDKLNSQQPPATIGGFRSIVAKAKEKIAQEDKSDFASKAKDPSSAKPMPEFVGLEEAGAAGKTVAGLGGMGLKAVAAANAGASLAGGTNSILDGQINYANWQLPPLDLLDPVPEIKVKKNKKETDNNRVIIEQTLASFGIEAKVQEVMEGPSVTQYALDIALGIKVSKIANLKNDLALALATAANAVRIEAPIPDTSYIGIEIPNSERKPVFFRELVEDEKMAKSGVALPVSVGKDIAGHGIVADIQKMPHLLIAGATGSGKSVLTNSFILSLLMKRSPDEVRFILVDPKQVELSDYNGIPHLLTPVIVEMDKVLNALKWSVSEMERRYTVFRDAQVKNLEAYNQKMGYTALPYIVIVIDEMADMMLTAGRADLETNIVRLAQKARATGIHLILATQRPSVNVITGLIKANIPGRVGMSVTTQIDSRVILDVIGAESLLGKGDLLFKEPDKNKPYRVQGVYVHPHEIHNVVNFIKEQAGENVQYIDEIVASKEEDAGEGGDNVSLSGDDMFADAVRVIVAAQKGSASLLQRKLSLGYNRAAKLIDEMEELGIVGAPNGAKPREVLITDAEGFLQSLKGE